MVAAGAAITLYAAWNARNLVPAWQHSPYDRRGFPAFLLWNVPLASLWISRLLDFQIRNSKLEIRNLHGSVSPVVFAIALVVSFSGAAADLYVLEYLGLAIALAGFLPVRPATLAWLACACAWMPAAGWAFSSYGPVLVNFIRAVIGLAAVSMTPLILRNEKAC
jgi:hypothetical protein